MGRDIILNCTRQTSLSNSVVIVINYSNYLNNKKTTVERDWLHLGTVSSCSACRAFQVDRRQPAAPTMACPRCAVGFAARNVTVRRSASTYQYYYCRYLCLVSVLIYLYISTFLYSSRSYTFTCIRGAIFGAARYLQSQDFTS